MPGTCPLCLAEESRELFVKDGVPYRLCRRCGFRFADWRKNPNLTTRMDAYADAYVQYLEPGPADEINYRRLLEWLGGFADLRAGCVLDVGCGSGKWVRFLRAGGIEALGIEPAEALYERYLAGDECFRRATAGDLATAGKETYTVITAMDVIEHVVGVRDFAAGIAKLLAPGGVVMVSTPNVASAAARLAGRFWHFYEKYHLGYFCRATLVRLFGEFGMTPLYAGCRGKHFPVGYLLRYAANFLAGRSIPKLSASLDRISIPLNTHEILYAVFRKGH